MAEEKSKEKGKALDDKALEGLRRRLDETQKWPSMYVFKFIVPSAQLDRVIDIFRGKPVTLNHSKKGNYVSVTSELMMQTSVEVIEFYRRAAKIKGIISL